MKTGISTNFLLWALLVFSCPDPGWTTPAEEMASLEVKMNNIMERMTRMEAEMETKDKRMAVLEAAVETLEKAAVTKDAIKTRDLQMWELEEEMRSLTGRLDEVRNPPFAFQCGWRYDQWTAADSVITVVPTWIEQSIRPTNTFI